MAFDDFLESEVGVAVAVTAVVASPAVRRVLRKGAVYGLAGALMAGDAVASLARGVRNGVQPSGDQSAPASREEGGAEGEASETSETSGSHEGQRRSSTHRSGAGSSHSGGQRGEHAHA